MNNLQNFSCLINEIEKAKLNNSLIVVEGKKDKEALEELGFSFLNCSHVLTILGSTIRSTIAYLTACSFLNLTFVVIVKK